MTSRALVSRSPPKWARAPFILALLGCASVVATAQQISGSPPMGAASSTGVSPIDQITEIVVTAEKRDSTVQATPISITPISGAELNARGLTNVLEVAQQTPTLPG